MLKAVAVVKSRFHDGFEHNSYHEDCRIFQGETDPRYYLLLRTDDQLRVSSDAAQKEALAASADARAANAALYEIVDALKGAKAKDVKALVEANGHPILNGTKPKSGPELLMIAADGARSVRRLDRTMPARTRARRFMPGARARRFHVPPPRA